MTSAELVVQYHFVTLYMVKAHLKVFDNYIQFQFIWQTLYDFMDSSIFCTQVQINFFVCNFYWSVLDLGLISSVPGTQGINKSWVPCKSYWVPESFQTYIYICNVKHKEVSYNYQLT